MIRHPNRWAPEEIFAAVASALILVVSGYFAVAGVLAPGSVVPGGEAHAARIYAGNLAVRSVLLLGALGWAAAVRHRTDRKSTRLNSSHDQISYAVFCLKKKKKK